MTDFKDSFDARRFSCPIVNLPYLIEEPLGEWKFSGYGVRFMDKCNHIEGGTYSKGESVLQSKRTRPDFCGLDS